MRNESVNDEYVSFQKQKKT